MAAVVVKAHCAVLGIVRPGRDPVAVGVVVVRLAVVVGDAVVHPAGHRARCLSRLLGIGLQQVEAAVVQVGPHTLVPICSLFTLRSTIAWVRQAVTGRVEPVLRISCLCQPALCVVAVSSDLPGQVGGAPAAGWAGLERFERQLCPVGHLAQRVVAIAQRDRPGVGR